MFKQRGRGKSHTGRNEQTEAAATHTQHTWGVWRRKKKGRSNPRSLFENSGTLSLLANWEEREEIKGWFNFPGSTSCCNVVRDCLQGTAQLLSLPPISGFISQHIDPAIIKTDVSTSKNDYKVPFIRKSPSFFSLSLFLHLCSIYRFLSWFILDVPKQ